MRDHPEYRFLEHVLGLRARRVPVRAVSGRDACLRESYGKTAFRLRLEQGWISKRRARFFALHPAPSRKSSGGKPSWRRIARNVPDAISPLPVGTIANR